MFQCPELFPQPIRVLGDKSLDGAYAKEMRRGNNHRAVGMHRKPQGSAVCTALERVFHSCIVAPPPMKYPPHTMRRFGYTLSMHTPGLHHVTGITGDAQKNIDFYSGVLGLRFVKLTVNFDDPSAYHLYYGNESGEPGTALTFFAWPNVHKGQTGVGEITAIAFAIPRSALPFWQTHLAARGVSCHERERFGEAFISFLDPDGLELEIVPESPSSPILPWISPLIPAEHAIRGFHAVTLTEDGSEMTRRFLTERFGYAPQGESDSYFRYEAGGTAPARYLYVRVAPDLQQGEMGAGTVHHVAFRAESDADEISMRNELLAIGRDATPVIDRMYFHSVYFREPGGILFEIATVKPGFTVDEPLAELGTSLCLPAQYEPHRAEITRVLPKLALPSYG